jgi:hypothetical protein
MNHIHRITRERDEAIATMRKAREQLTDLQRYLTSSKFSAPDADYVHVRTDILPKISEVCFTLIDG